MSFYFTLSGIRRGVPGFNVYCIYQFILLCRGFRRGVLGILKLFYFNKIFFPGYLLLQCERLGLAPPAGLGWQPGDDSCQGEAVVHTSCRQMHVCCSLSG